MTKACLRSRACSLISSGSMSTHNNLHNLQISERPPRTWNQILRVFWVWLFFTFCCTMINGTQFMILLPLRISLRLSPSPRLSALHREGIRWTKGNFGSLLGGISLIPLCISIETVLNSSYEPVVRPHIVIHFFREGGDGRPDRPRNREYATQR